MYRIHNNWKPFFGIINDGIYYVQLTDIFKYSSKADSSLSLRRFCDKTHWNVEDIILDVDDTFLSEEVLLNSNMTYPKK